AGTVSFSACFPGSGRMCRGETGTRRAPESRSTGMTFAKLESFVDAPADGDRSLRVCVVSYEVEGPARCTGMAAEAADIAIGLADAGHDVTLLQVPSHYCVDGRFEDWVDYYRTQSVQLVALERPIPANSKTWLDAFTAGCNLGALRPG